MKRNLLLVAFMAIAGIAKLHAQSCTASNLNIVIKNVTSGTNGCQVTLDVSFTGNFNNGNKFAFIHLWETAPVNNYPIIDYTLGAPTPALLANAIATIVIENPGQNNASLYNQYPAYPAVPVKYAGVTFNKSGTTFTMSNVVVNISTCSVPVTVKGDVWASQSNLSQVVHCENDGIITILFNNPVIGGFKQCSVPRKLNLSFKNDHTFLNESVVASVYIDVNINGIIDAADLDITSSLSPALPNPIVLPPNTTQVFTGLTYAPFSAMAEHDGKPIMVKAIATAPGAATVSITKNDINFLGSCSLLPVGFGFFTAKRDGTTVKLQWETSFEQNNEGFVIERYSNRTWTQVGYVPTQGAGGNSNAKLIYSFEEINNAKSVSQYRLKQLDLDGKFSYSEVRSVAGADQMGRVIVYPNPSTNGKVNVVLEEAGLHDLSLTDMSGRVIRQWKAVYNNLQIDNLIPGIYHLRIMNRETNKLVTEKISVTK